MPFPYILQGFALVADMTYIQQSACRLMRALFEIAMKRGWASLSSRVLTICKMIEKRTWCSQSPLRQFSGIPEIIIRKLEKNSDITWERYYDLKPQDLGEMVKIPKMGKSLHKYVHMFPKVELSANVHPITRSLLKVDLTISPDFQYDSQVHEFAQLFWIIVEDVDGEKILHSEPFILRMQYATVEHSINFTVPMYDPIPPQYFVKVISDRWLHSESILPISFRHLLLPQKFAPPTELLDLQPLPVPALRNKIFESLFVNLKHFNPIQTQTFASLYESDDNVLVCAPNGSGKTVCAEFALLRAISSNLSAKCVYLVPKQEMADARFSDWSKRFATILEKDDAVVKLSGETTGDLKLLEKANIIICTAVQWDILSRRWKQRKNVQQISLYIADEIHLIGGNEGPTYEFVLSRARYIASQLESRVRIVGLGASIANAKDIGDWIGVSPHSVFNFTPDVRPVPLEVHIHGFEAYHAGSRLLAMSKPVFNAIMGHSPNKPAIVFVPSRKQSQLTAIDIMTYIAASGNPEMFLQISSEKMSNVLSTIKEPALVQTLSKGIAFLHSGLPKSDRERVLGLYRDNIVSILVCPHDFCWSLQTPAHLVVVMDTVYYEGREHSFVDYSITDVMQMVGLASRPALDDSGTCVILCHSPKKDFLKKILHDPLPVESHLDHYLHDHLNSEVVTKTVENKQEAVDYLTWTFYYRRLSQNPNYYNLLGTSHRHLSDHLSELIENVITDLEESKCLTVEDEMELAPLNLGMISSYYYIQYTTIELFASSLTAKTKIKGLIEILSSASEYGQLPIRLSEESQLKKLANHLPQPLLESANFEDPATKALILLQCHFSRQPLPTDLSSDVAIMLRESSKLIQSIVDVISSQGWLRPALAAMELSQMVVQGQWSKDSVLLQIPHFTENLVEKCKKITKPVETVFDLLDLDDDVRDELLQFTSDKMSDVALFCNSYPNVELTFLTNLENDEVCCFIFYFIPFIKALHLIFIGYCWRNSICSCNITERCRGCRIYTGCCKRTLSHPQARRVVAGYW